MARQGLEACNGWTSGIAKRRKGLTLIDELRAQMRAEMADDGPSKLPHANGES